MSGPPPAGEELWAFRTPGSTTIVGEPLIVGGALAFTKGSVLYAIDRRDGSPLRSTPLIERSGLRKWFGGPSDDDFESTHGIPMLSLSGNSLVASFHDPSGEAVDAAFDLTTGSRTDLEGFDPFALALEGGRYLLVDERTTGAAPVLLAMEDDGTILWDSRWATTRGFDSAEWLSPAGRPVVGDGRVLFGIRETTLERGTAIAHRLYAFRVDDGELLWEHPNHALDREILGLGYDGRHFFVVVRQREGTPRLRMLDGETGKTVREANFPGLTSGIAIAGGVLYGGFGRSLVAVALSF